MVSELVGAAKNWVSVLPGSVSSSRFGLAASSSSVACPPVPVRSIVVLAAGVVTVAGSIPV
jgi:hypothetical protein